jgi:hypothetical protein
MVHKITSLRKENMKLELPQAIDYFVTAMTLEGKSLYTVLWHRKKLPAFAKFLQNSGRSLKVGDLAVEDPRAFIKHLMERMTRFTDHAASLFTSTRCKRRRMPSVRRNSKRRKNSTRCCRVCWMGRFAWRVVGIDHPCPTHGASVDLRRQTCVSAPLCVSCLVVLRFDDDSQCRDVAQQFRAVAEWDRTRILRPDAIARPS